MPDNREVTAAFLQELYAGVPGGQWLTLFSLDRTTGRPMTKWHRVDSIDAMVQDAHALGESACVWFGIATRKECLQVGRGGTEDCALIPALWVDIDVQGRNHKSTTLPPTMDAARELLADFSEAPSFVVETGGGLQPYWLLDAPMTIGPDLIELLDWWRQTWQDFSAERGWTIDNTWDVARILRLPGTFNRKNEPKLVTLHAK